MKTIERILNVYNAGAPLRDQIKVDLRPLRSQIGTWCASVRFVVTDEVFHYPPVATDLNACRPSMAEALDALEEICEAISFA